MILALEVDEKIQWLRNKKKHGSEIRKNMNISKSNHAIYVQISTSMHLISDHIVSKYKVNREIL